MNPRGSLLWHPRFRGLFWTQALGAFNDNFFKQALLFLVVYNGLTWGGLSEKELSILATSLLLLPFMVFSATAGQLADKYEKSGIIVLLKQVEIIVSLVAVAGLLSANLPLLLVVLFFYGMQATFFGPLKYAILPQLLSEEKLVAGNALVETGTKLAILLGSLGGGLLVVRPHGPVAVSVIMVSISLLGWVAARTIPQAPGAEPDLQVRWNPIPPTLEVYKLTRSNRPVFLSILGISWFWLVGAAFVSLFPSYCKSVLSAGDSVASAFNALFSIGVALGAIFCNKFSYDRLELGLVPFGSIGMSVFAADLYLIGRPWSNMHSLQGIGYFLSQPVGIRIFGDLLFLAMFSGFFIIPLYTMVQQRTPERIRSRVVAGNNVLNSFFVVLAAGLLIGLSRLGLTIPQTFGVIALLNAVVAMYIYGLIPEFFLRFLAYLLAHFVYRLKVVGHAYIPREKAAVLACNHVSWVDWLIIAAGIRRPVRFVMWYTYAQLPLLRYLFRDAGVIPIASAKSDPKLLEKAMAEIAKALREDELVCIFPEGKITSDGELSAFREGIVRIVDKTPVEVIPMAIKGLWGSVFSRFRPRSWRERFQMVRFRREVTLNIGKPIQPDQLSVDTVKRAVKSLLEAF